MNFGPNQFGFSRGTSMIVSNDFGQTWGSTTAPYPANASPANFRSLLNDPFPVRADGTRYDQPTREALGAMAYQGRGFGFVPWNLRHPRQQRWQVNVQHAIGKSMVVNATYAGSFSDRISQFSSGDNIPGRPLQPVPQNYWATGTVRDERPQSLLNANVPNPFFIGNFRQQDFSPQVWSDLNSNGFFTQRIIARNRLLRAFPNINGLTDNGESTGTTRTQEFQASFEKRFSQGWNINLAYSGMRIFDRDVFLNEFDAERHERPSNDGRPHRFTGTGVYSLPIGKGRKLLGNANRFVDMAVGGWQFAATYEWQPGPLLNFGNLFYYGSDLNNLKNVNRTWDAWFNTADFERTAARGPAGYHVRVFPTRIDGLRQDSTNQWNANASKSFNLNERGANLQLRVNALNVQNRSQMAGPNLDPFNTQFGRVLAQTAATNRWIEVQARIQF
jgi:hypothetical protein